MSLYQLHRAMYRFLNPGDAVPVPLDRAELQARFDLTDREAEAFVKADVKELYRLGVHPVMLNGFARARMDPPAYRATLATLASEERAAAD